MRGRGLRAGLGAVVAAVAMALGAGGASATTFCVPSFHAACPSSGGNVAKADLEEAMNLLSTDGQADEIRLAAGTFVESAVPYEPSGGSGETLEPGGTDDLTIVGAGPGQTVVTSVASTNSYVVNLNFNNARKITMRDFTIRAPASMPDGLGAVIQGDRDDFLNVDVESRNPGSDGITMVGGGRFEDGRIFGAAGGSIGDAIRTNGAKSGEMRIERSSIEDASWGILVDHIAVVTRIRRTRIINPVAYGLRVTTGAFAVMDNSIVVTEDGIAVSIESGNTDIVIATVRHSTIVDTGGADNPAIDVGDTVTPANGSVNAVISDTIVAGNEAPLKCDSPMSTTSLTVKYSWLFHSGTSTGNCTVSAVQSLDAFSPQVGPPVFVAVDDYRLPAGSPGIDAGDPLVITLPTEDFLGAPRPVDGDGDARRDIGAFELQPPPPTADTGVDAGSPSTPPPVDTTAPETRIARGPGKGLARGRASFHFRSSEAGSTFVCKLDRRKARPCRSPRKYAGLKPGRHVFRVWATDAAGNRDPTPAKRSFRVPAA